MADPLSISMSVLTVLGSGMTVAKALNAIISRYKTAPAAILALSNEVSDLVVLIQEIKDTIFESETAIKLSVFLDRTDSKLHEVQLFVTSVGVLGSTKQNRMRYERLTWAAKKSRRAEELKHDLHDVKLSIILLLSTVTISQLHLARNVSIIQSINRSQPVADAEPTPRTVEDLVNTANSETQIDTISIQLKPHQNICNKWCTCICHRRSKLRSPRLLDNVFGTLFLGYSQLPLFTRNCSETSCWQNNPSSTSVMYHFPKWLIERAVFLALLSTNEPTVSLKIPRIVDPKAAIVELSRSTNPDIEGVKRLFEAGKASPNDIDGKTGFSLLYYAVLSKNVRLSKFLLQAGADPYLQDYRGKTPVDNIQLNSLAAGRWWDACGGLLNPWKPRELAEMVDIFANSSFIQENGFTRLHKAVIQAQPARLREELEISTKDIDQPDGEGYTPLNWAATRMDPECMEILLSYGANLECDEGRAGFLLGGLITHVDLDDQTRMRRDLCLKILIRYGQSTYGKDYVNQMNKIERTPFMLACFCGEAEVMSLLREAGADINVENKTHETALMYCINDYTGKALAALLEEPGLVRTFHRKPMMRILKDLQGYGESKHLQPFIDAQMCCPELSEKDWKRLKKWRKRSWRIPELVSRDQKLWDELLAGIKSRGGFPLPLLSDEESDSEESEQESDFAASELDASSSEESDALTSGSDGEDQPEEDRFEDALEF